MKLKLYTLVFLSAFFLTSLQAQDYLISFAGSGASATVATVKVENLTQVTVLTMNGNDILHLKNVITGIESYGEEVNQRISISPNPTTDYSLIKFDLPEDGETTTSIYDITGRIILQVQDHLNKGRHTYMIRGINNGLYIVKVVSNKYSVSGRLLCSGPYKSNPKIIYENAGVTDKKEYDSKGISTETVMQYNAGDRLKLTGISDIYSTVITDMPTESKTITFDFIACTDGEGNNYPIVQIGSQIWMGENLKTTKFNNGTVIPYEDIIYISQSMTEPIPRTPGYCWYNNESLIGEVYGALYNWHSVNTKKLCPIGWHVPFDLEWYQMELFLDPEAILWAEVSSVAGGKLKETGVTHWSSANSSTNETGFTALPAGVNGFSNDGGLHGNWYGLGERSDWWTSTLSPESEIEAFTRILFYSSKKLYRGTNYKAIGNSVRCIRNDIPSVTTKPIINITLNTATTGGDVKSDGGITVTERGVCWSVDPNPTVANSITIDGSGTGAFTSNLTGLAPNTSYYVRAFATNSIGTGYGNELSFKTTITLPTVSTEPITEISYTTAKAGGNITSDGSSTVIARGVCWSNAIDPTIEDNKTIDGAGVGSFISTLTDLTTNTTYYVRAYATNAAGTAYGMALAFTTLSPPPTVGLVAYFPFNGNANDESGSGNNGTVIGATLTTDRFGNLNSAYSFDGINDDISGSTINWPYSNSPRTISLWGYIRTLPTANGFFLTYGQQTTSNINSVYFQYVEGFGKTIVYAGFLDDIQTLYNYALDKWYNILVTFDGTIAKIYGNGIFISEANKNNWNTLSSSFHFGSLDNGTSFLNGAVDDIRIYDRILTNYEIQQLYREGGYTQPEVVFDVDGNVYNIVKIGNQVWMAENLKTTKYFDGTDITLVTDATQWSNLATPGYCWYNNNVANKDTYGALYNWYTVNTAKLCPAGWHVPTDAEWITLENFLIANGYNYDGTITGNKFAKALASITLWVSNPAPGAVGNTDYPAKRNATGFTALPGGRRTSYSIFSGIGYGANWWSATESDTSNPWARDMDYGNSNVYRYNSSKKEGVSVRCLRD